MFRFVEKRKRRKAEPRVEPSGQLSGQQKMMRIVYQKTIQQDYTTVVLSARLNQVGNVKTGAITRELTRITADDQMGTLRLRNLGATSEKGETHDGSTVIFPNVRRKKKTVPVLMIMSIVLIGLILIFVPTRSIKSS